MQSLIRLQVPFDTLSNPLKLLLGQPLAPEQMDSASRLLFALVAQTGCSSHAPLCRNSKP